MICTRYDANPCAEPCAGCAEKSIVCAETFIGDDIYCCYETANEALERAAAANRTGIRVTGPRICRIK